MGQLDGKVALITGGSSGIGRATAAIFAEEGASVVITGRDGERLADAVAELGDGHLGIAGDVDDGGDRRRVIEAIEGRWGRLDVVFANAGIARIAPIATATPAHFDEVMSANLRGAFFTVQGALPLMGEGGSIILNGSVNALVGFSGASVYSASKAALHSLARTLGAELAPRDIRVNTLVIGPVQTPLYGTLGLDDETLGRFAEAVLAKLPVGRFGTVEEIAHAALFLASDASSFVRGAEVPVDGGLTTNALAL